MKLLISPQKKEDWKINKERFISGLKNLYQNAKFTINRIDSEKRYFCYEWTATIHEDFLEGMLDKDLNGVSFVTNSIEMAKNFSNFVRSEMPADSTILIYDTSFESSIVIPFEGISENDLLENF